MVCRGLVCLLEGRGLVFDIVQDGPSDVKNGVVCVLDWVVSVVG